MKKMGRKHLKAVNTTIREYPKQSLSPRLGWCGVLQTFGGGCFGQRNISGSYRASEAVAGPPKG